MRGGSVAAQVVSRLGVQTTIDWRPTRPFPGSTGLDCSKATRVAAAARHERYIRTDHPVSEARRYWMRPAARAMSAMASITTS